jgi:predicted kinase
LGQELGWEVFSSDSLRKKLAGFPLYERSSKAARKLLYSPGMTKKTYASLLSNAQAQLLKGRSVILDATFARREHRALLARRFTKRGIPWHLLEAEASNAAVKKRLRTRETKPDEVSDARLEDFEMLTRLYEPPVELPAAQWSKVGTAGSLGQTVRKALQFLARARVGSARA